MKFENKIVSQELLTQEDFVALLDNLGREEWELVTVTQIHTPIEKTTAYLKRTIGLSEAEIAAMTKVTSPALIGHAPGSIVKVDKL